MKYGDTVKGDCKFCGYTDFSFLEGEKESYMVGSKIEKHIKGMCLSCGWVQWARVYD